MTEDEDKCMICGCNYQIYGQDKICDECRTEPGTLIEFGEQRATERIVGIIKKRREIVNSTINSISGIARKIYGLGWDECMSWLLKEIESKK